MTVSTLANNYQASFKWDHEINAGISFSDNKSPILFSPPVEYGGNDSTWSPEHLLLASVGGCYMTTFMHFSKLLKVTILAFHLSGKISFEKKDNGLEVSKIILNPKISLKNHPGQHVLDNLFEKAKKYCVISNSLKATLVVEPFIS